MLVCRDTASAGEFSEKSGGMTGNMQFTATISG